MDLGFLKDLGNIIKENDVIKNFINELGEFLENSNNTNKNHNIIDSEKIIKDIENKRNVSLVSRNKIKSNINDILNKNSNKLSNEDILKNINKMAEEVLDKQDENLSKYRKEGHLYLVEEDVNDRIYLWDMTDKPKISIEEVDFPKELKKDATEGNVFQYVNGQYKLYEENEVD